VRVLAVGVAALDIINGVASYPAEDAEIRADSQRWSRGGNSANTLVVLGQLGHVCAWVGVLADDPGSDFVLDDLARHGVDTSGALRLGGKKVPVSCVVQSAATGSRTIVHYRELPELSAEEFSRVELAGFDWVHFEGRNPSQTALMLEHVARRWPDLPCSVEVEKPRPGIENLFEYPKLLLFSRDYALSRGFSDGAEFLERMREECHGHLVCAWGDAGAWALDADGGCHSSPAYPPARVIDTLGAGDVFNAACIDGMLRDRPAEEILGNACRLAGLKCGRIGLEGLTIPLPCP
jgi:ketohexokinase